MDIKVINTANEIGENMVKRNGSEEMINADTKLIWMPGINPVIVPAKIAKHTISIFSINCHHYAYHKQLR